MIRLTDRRLLGDGVGLADIFMMAQLLAVASLVGRGRRESAFRAGAGRSRLDR